MSDTDKAQLRRSTKPAGKKAPPPPPLSPRAYAEFATFARRLTRAQKPVRFAGQHWRL